ncbi:hypothetical protein PCYB_093530 [Plasmodium cynomolgi strain B]|uniref:Parasitophorous vacuolar protein 1 n=1 Tax=Plasmodium cynomolgi (strain B) TaxID=1120755 RepID=K6UK74_PLACD|nr:hypothetical protein PCYB_093530 [Plasmodium cynomolgi strain B]GAB66568.1 hypothetical protein PCYB_093530 [Plasmodium cynomolgi strain B]
MMKKVALSMLLLLLPVYSLSIENEKQEPEEINNITGKLQVQNSEHEKFLNIINEIFTKKDESCKFSFSNNGFRCAFSKFDVNFNNGSKAMNALFTSENEQIIKDAAEEYKVKLMLELHNLRPPKTNLKNFKKDFQGICMKFFSELRRKIFHLYRNDESGQDGEDQGRGEITNVDQLTERLESTYDSDSTEDGSTAGKDGNQDLSELIEEDHEHNPDAPKMQQSSYSFSSHTSKKIMFDGNNVIEENENFINDGSNCTEEDQKAEKPFSVFFNSQLSRNHFSTVCNSNGKNFLRKAEGGSPFPMEPLNPDDLNRMMADMLKFFESQGDGNGMMLPFLSNMNFMDALNSLGFPAGLDFEGMFNDILKGNKPTPCCRGARPTLDGPPNKEDPPTTDDSDEQQ